MIVFKNESAFVEWNTLTNTIICNWKAVTNSMKMEEVIESIVEIRNENKIKNYVSNRSHLNYSWSGLPEWHLFFDADSTSLLNFEDVYIIDPHLNTNEQLKDSLETISDSISNQFEYKTFRNYKVYESVAEGYIIK
ncbi:hypothetical protein [Flammeovirga sp. SJP92]|uniref:hypothetical protein n=1 Tax=Flammeovirga sp. SJP92 TaxID=1775430 RepID=UPI000786F89C|nr:hypothetical protein [Flammeovirga sp. SJP92]KXX69686.1 hypothetical protein AVL50_12390 [Flammeovirga sp. SJP92]